MTLDPFVNLGCSDAVEFEHEDGVPAQHFVGDVVVDFTAVVANGVGPIARAMLLTKLAGT